MKIVGLSSLHLDPHLPLVFEHNAFSWLDPQLQRLLLDDHQSFQRLPVLTSTVLLGNVECPQQACEKDPHLGPCKISAITARWTHAKGVAGREVI